MLWILAGRRIRGLSRCVMRCLLGMGRKRYIGNVGLLPNNYQTNISNMPNNNIHHTNPKKDTPKEHILLSMSHNIQKCNSIYKVIVLIGNKNKQMWPKHVGLFKIIKIPQ